MRSLISFIVISFHIALSTCSTLFISFSLILISISAVSFYSHFTGDISILPIEGHYHIGKTEILQKLDKISNMMFNILFNFGGLKWQTISLLKREQDRQKREINETATQRAL